MGRTTRARSPSCLVAVDGTKAGVDALVWGLRHAAAHDMDVEVLTVWPAHHSVFVHEVPGHFCAPRWSARVAQENTLREAMDAVGPAPAVVTTLENADATEAIVRASGHHELVVLGCSGPPHEPHRLTDQVIEHSACDVVVAGADGPWRWSTRRRPSPRDVSASRTTSRRVVAALVPSSGRTPPVA